MGLDVNGVRFLLYVHRRGVDLSSVAMIGRQSLHLSPRQMRHALREFGHALDASQVDRLFQAHDGFAEGLLSYLGAKTIHSFDISDYEGATHVHDMNRPIPDAWKGQYALVLDGGSLEHVFHVSVALGNCMEMVRPTGHYMGISPVNNFMGHGFYQFSPEFFFRALDEDNGFAMDKLILVENRRGSRWYQARNPRDIRRRVTFTNSMPTYALVLARRTRMSGVFASTPQQSDYQADWSEGRLEERRGRISGHPLSRLVYKPLERRVKRLARCFFSGFNRRFFQPFDPLA